MSKVEIKKNGSNGKRRGNGEGTIRKIGKFYYALFYIRDSVTGQRTRICKATKTDVRSEALEVLNRYKEEYATKGAIINPLKEKLSKKAIAKRESFDKRWIDKANTIEIQQQKIKAELQQKEEEENARVEAEKRANAITISYAIIAFEHSLARPQCGERTLWDYQTQWKNFETWMKQNHPEITKMYEVDSKVAKEYALYVRSNFAYTTYNKRITFMRMMWRIIKQEDDSLITDCPWNDGIALERKQLDYQRRRDITTDELRRTLNVIASEDMKNTLAFHFAPQTEAVDLRAELIGLFCIGIYTGLRMGDCINLKWGNIDFEENTINLSPAKTMRCDYELKIPLHKVLKSKLLLAENRKGYLLPNLAEIYNHHDPALVSTRIQKAFRAAGIETIVQAKRNGRNRTEVGFHSIRHFFCSTLANAGVNAEMVNYLSSHGGHGASITATYYHSHTEALEKAISILPAIEETLPAESRARLEIVSEERERLIEAFVSLGRSMDKETLERALKALAS